jgi:hypothetical protein
MLKGSDGTAGLWEDSLEMGEDLRGGSVFLGELGWQTVLTECGADLALAEAEAFPDAQPGPVAEMAWAVADGSEDTFGEGLLEEPPQGAGGQSEASDFVGRPDAEGAATARSCPAVAAKEASSADGLSVGTGVVKAVEKAMSDESADTLAVGTGGVFEAFGKGVVMVVIEVKRWFVVHWSSSAPLPLWRKGEGRGSGV